ncbi:MAG: hypothetical protein GXY08_02795 [Ruminococcus sp.]|nr:hypothetical protein [Ruminococcus sp.]
MKVEFLVNQEIGVDGRQLFIQESEFKKAKDDLEEYNSFAFATNCLFSFYGAPDDYISRDEYETILSALEKGGAVIISIVEERYPRRISPEVYVSNNNRLKKIVI